MGRVVLVACTNVGRAMIEALENRESLKTVELVGIVNLKPEAALEKANYDSYIDLVRKYGLNIYYCDNINEDGCIEFLKNCHPDVMIQSGWSQKFQKQILDIPTYGCIGEHPAPLPRGRGAACVNWAIITGEHEWGDTFFRMEAEYDTGCIYSQEYFNIELYDDVKTVYDKVAKAAVDAIEKHLASWVEGDLKGREQEDTKATHYPRRKPSDGEFNFNKSALDVYNHIRGQARPYPGAFFYCNMNGVEKKIFVWKALYGVSSADGGVAVVCADGKEIVLLRIQVEGEIEGWAEDYLNRIDLGEINCGEDKR